MTSGVARRGALANARMHSGPLSEGWRISLGNCHLPELVSPGWKVQLRLLRFVGGTGERLFSRLGMRLNRLLDACDSW